MKWNVTISHKASKGLLLLPDKVKKSLYILLREIEISGPVRGNWPNYGKLGKNRHHCHLKKGKPAYAAVWEVLDKKIRLAEVIYAGTHEKAPY